MPQLLHCLPPPQVAPPGTNNASHISLAAVLTGSSKRASFSAFFPAAYMALPLAKSHSSQHM
eukprot:CAMPEP_0198504120 /NCGR_PEP_ID=MMETSP1462-20131121/10315_1 /TAXON_ID=1333877 /ORGANISM="Brandtodinium nutriculum, Strain RCC3387" /LENGTH=61 /DNA_ID=CAMNT_0044233273 /DNA_START=25 /DNA_END=210 /DNA_ORIENTATION=+